jgi:hypothetical protein
MVVIGIIVMAAAMMAPTIAEYMKNRQIDGVRGQMVSIFNIARLQAVSRRRSVSVVFFREGPRIFDEISKSFTDDDVWNPDTTVLGKKNEHVWYALGFARGATSYEERYDSDPKYWPRGLHIPPFDRWVEKHEKAWAAADGKGKGSRRRTSRKPKVHRYNINGLYKVTFRRDGSLEFGAGGADVPTSTYNKETDGAPANADLVVMQVDGNTAVYIDLRATGQVRAKLGLLVDPPIKKGEIGPIEAATRGKKKRSSRK